MSANPVVTDILTVLGEALTLGDRVFNFDESTPLLGDLPEFDSMAVVTLVGAIEDRFGFTIDDDEISADIFETVGSLCQFVANKCST